MIIVKADTHASTARRPPLLSLSFADHISCALRRLITKTKGLASSPVSALAPMPIGQNGTADYSIFYPSPSPQARLCYHGVGSMAPLNEHSLGNHLELQLLPRLSSFSKAKSTATGQAQFHVESDSLVLQACNSITAAMPP